MSGNIKLDSECEHHKPLITTKYGLVTDITSICCLRHHVLSEFHKRPRSILVPESETKWRKDILVWTGLVNGEKGIGVMKDFADFMTMDTDEDFLEAKEVQQCLLQSKIQIFILNIIDDKDNEKGIKIFVNFDEIGIKIFNPIRISAIDKSVEINKLMKIQKYGSNNFVRVKYKVLVNGIPCLSCTDLVGDCRNLPEETRVLQMFYVPIKEIKSCFNMNSQDHSPLNASGSGVEYKSVCCIEEVDKFEEYPWIHIDVELSKQYKKYKCKWMGEMNGELIIGIERDTNLADSNKTLSNLVVPGNDKLIFSKLNTFNYGAKISKSLGCCIIDPAIDIVIKAKHLIDANNTVYVYVGDDRKRGVIKLRGNINGSEVVGCEMDKEFGSGTDGMFGRIKLFDCGDKRGVLIVQDDKLRCCEVDGRHNDVVVDNLDKIDEKCFCCLKTVEKVEGYEKIVVGQSYSRNNGEKWILADCQWVGLVNGNKKVGMFEMPDKEGFLYALWSRLFGSSVKQIYIYLIKINADIILCDVLSLLIVKPESVTSVVNEEIINKQLIFSTFDRKNMTAMQKWKGLIHGCPVIGLELNKKSKYGTNGEFNGHKLFSCDNGTGVLMVLEGFTKTCANGSHDELQFRKNMMIKEDNICCIETTTATETTYTVGMAVKINKEIEGICKWIGKINGQSCVGIELNKALGKLYDGKLSGIKLFECKSEHGYITKVEFVKIEGNTIC